MIGKTEVVGGVTGLSHGWSHSVTTVLYGFNRVGQLVSATGRTVSEQNQNVRTPRRDAAGQIVGDTLSNGRLDNEAAFTGVMVDGYDTSDTNRNGSRDEEVWTIRYGCGPGDVVGDGEHVCDHFGSSAGGEERNDE
ncbi:MAG: hypothetical protein IPL32_20520 [Chloracidobacterium sp.]|nr:hypothetical protein [Chloracidobacterium sp.]